jgi:ABC-type polysaccharide/polyol phosphate transport system ATPase subunit
VNTVLSIETLSKRYTIGTRNTREVWALRDVSFEVPRGEILGVIGPNGAGKTTLLKILARVTPPTEGRVVGRGRVVPLLALGAGFQQDLSGRENVFLNAAMYGISAGEVEQRLDDIVEFAGIGEFLDFPVKKYSSGMYLRLAFSVAVNMRPDILLADEVLAVGDLEFQERCLQRVQREGEAGMTVLFVSHDMAAIARLCQRVLWLNAGEVVRIGPAEEIVQAYQNSAWSLAGGQLSKRKGGSHRSSIGEILDVSLHSADGQQIGAAKATDEVRMRIVHRFGPDAVGYGARYTVHVKARGAVAFRSRAPIDIPIEAPGVYTAEVSIPPNLLADTIYTVDVNVVGWKTRHDHVPMVAANALTFQVFSPESEQRDHVGGVVSPRLGWRLLKGQDATPEEVTTVR